MRILVPNYYMYVYLATEIGLSCSFLSTTLVVLGTRGAGFGGVWVMVRDLGTGRGCGFGLLGSGRGLVGTAVSVKSLKSGMEELSISVLVLMVSVGWSKLVDLDGRGLLLSMMINMQSS